MPSRCASVKTSVALRSVQLVLSAAVFGIAVWFLIQDGVFYPLYWTAAVGAVSVIYLIMTFLSTTPMRHVLARPAIVSIFESFHFGIWTATTVILGLVFRDCGNRSVAHYNGFTESTSCGLGYTELAFACILAVSFVGTFGLHTVCTWPIKKRQGCRAFAVVPYHIGQIFTNDEAEHVPVQTCPPTYEGADKHDESVQVKSVADTETIGSSNIAYDFESIHTGKGSTYKSNKSVGSASTYDDYKGEKHHSLRSVTETLPLYE
ncbi:hypothetical protein DICA4_C05930 [Diutina catenulata]